MKELKIEALWGDRYPFASFHDALIHAISLDYQARSVKMQCTILVGDPDADRVEREANAEGILDLSGLLYCIIESPDTNYSFEEGSLDISSNGSVATTQFKKLLPALPAITNEEAFLHWFFVSNWNAMIFIAATGARFVWK